MTQGEEFSASPRFRVSFGPYVCHFHLNLEISGRLLLCRRRGRAPFQALRCVANADHNRRLSFISFDMGDSLHYVENFPSDHRRGAGQFGFSIFCGYRNLSIGGAAKRDFFSVSVNSMQNSQGNPFQGALFGILFFMRPAISPSGSVLAKQSHCSWTFMCIVRLSSIVNPLL